jgi:nicotinic acid mononucleotide adenylyltransferase
LVGAVFPYSQAETSDFIGFTPTKFVSEETAIDLAISAYTRAIDLGDPDNHAIGLGVTASVASLTAHRGDHRYHIACMTKLGVYGLTMVLEKGVGTPSRLKDGAEVDAAALRVLLNAQGIRNDEELQIQSWSEKARAHFFTRPMFRADGSRRMYDETVPSNYVLFPGAFNPPHEGHAGIRDSLQEMDLETVFTVCATPPHKDPLELQEMLERARRLRGGIALFTEGDPLYLDKARKFPGRSFVIGADALVRMLDPKWGPDPIEMLREMDGLGTKFYIFGRSVSEGYVTADEAWRRTPDAFKSMFIPVAGRWDISSTEIRRRESAPAQPSP